jgi:hypothetical protein
MSVREQSPGFGLLGIRATRPEISRWCSALLLGGATTCFACSPSGNGPGNQVTPPRGGSNAGEAAGSLGAPGGSGGAGGSSGSGGVPNISIPQGDAQVVPDAGCAKTSSRAVQNTKEVPITKTVEKPIDLYIMFDATQSVSCPLVFGQPTTRWDAFKTAMQQFVQLPAAAGVSVGIQYYGQNESCDRAVYAQPNVPIAPLPGNGAAIVASLNARVPAGSTPLDAALGGAIDHARSWAASHTDHTVAVVLVTDAAGNFPCGPLANASNVAADGVSGMPSIPTYVIGTIPAPGEPACLWDVGGAPTEGNLHPIAQSGGTAQAVLVQTGSDAAAQFLAALSRIRQTVTKTETRTEITFVPVPCEFKIPDPPDGGTFDKGKVNFQFTSAGSSQGVGYVPAAADCSRVAAGWYYEDPVAPTKILVCPQTCTAIQASSSTQIDIILGCASVPAPVQ